VIKIIPNIRIENVSYNMNLIFQMILLLIINFSFSSIDEKAGSFIITRLQYSGGGDWYADPSSIPNLLEFIDSHTNVDTNKKENRAKIGEDEFYDSYYIYLTGHGNISFSDKEAQKLRRFLLEGGFMHADDNYGMDTSFRREMKKVFPDKEWIELPNTHSVFDIYYQFDNGLPKIHEHDNKRPQALALFDEEKIIAIYTYESDLGDGWEDQTIHGNPEEIRQQALKMGTNIVLYSLTR